MKEKLLAPKHKDHTLTGNYAGFRECHITLDWLLIYAVDKGNLILTATRTGTLRICFNAIAAHGKQAQRRSGSAPFQAPLAGSANIPGYVPEPTC